jgi:hypothetical protein
MYAMHAKFYATHVNAVRALAPILNLKKLEYVHACLGRASQQQRTARKHQANAFTRAVHG